MNRINEVDHARVSLEATGAMKVEMPEQPRRMVKFLFEMQRRGFSASMFASFLLKLPADAKIMAVVDEHYQSATAFYIESSEFPEKTEQGYSVPQGTVRIRREEFGNRFMDVTVESVEWPT